MRNRLMILVALLSIGMAVVSVSAQDSGDDDPCTIAQQDAVSYYESVCSAYTIGGFCHAGTAQASPTATSPGTALDVNAAGALGDGGYSITSAPHGVSILYGQNPNGDGVGTIMMQMGYTTVRYDGPTLDSIAIETGYEAYAARHGESPDHECTDNNFSQVVIITPEGEETPMRISTLDDVLIGNVLLGSAARVTADDVIFELFLMYGEAQANIADMPVAEREEADAVFLSLALNAAQVVSIVQDADAAGEGLTRANYMSWLLKADLGYGETRWADVLLSRIFKSLPDDIQEDEEERLDDMMLEQGIFEALENAELGEPPIVIAQEDGWCLQLSAAPNECFDGYFGFLDYDPVNQTLATSSDRVYTYVGNNRYSFTAPKEHRTLAGTVTYQSTTSLIVINPRLVERHRDEPYRNIHRVDVLTLDP